ncbi:hypothetical protein COW36_00690 [bacterium (Candidatus Blackallbacteria) CG17_big_fil_post_rev_8_21_14_2_50_48_46]|uniref:PEGA domain-containing protein n=1 Tax=bacterium (Candidatus Blackallbacteria) CG17_big_fil_post_rev_8_21_14_2_50_48_46 TaxID=2014261 RepID=A0A2M7GB34_9BACT|nr:MAG: hypothetical protein COW64_10485 [bacterium (Candidatus Blackallbacteria) CG18_big_fil_WC_8_21_14_2_50_49_26]PIW19387.1 MAG: hypothetical protein COW36_00690 [bacterium (Candidatus Blackallbacteria) CG17_big_fil_post_rev_8_21_14_2_50_48_46]PIW49009.1 MAG: hypothetical protein COW20_07765 [bacterium (Candidatus Blackallbacteria) CG13_big_fil_rev_8_21_14_2_50_49_14]
MFKYTLLFFVLFSFNPSFAQINIATKNAGEKTGAFLGQQASLLKSPKRQLFPLRIGILPWYFETPVPLSQALESTWAQRLSETQSARFQFKRLSPEILKAASPEPLSYPYPRNLWSELCHRHKIDLFLQTHIEKTSQGFWFNIQFIDGISGKIIKSNQKLLKSIEINELTEFIQKTFNALPASASENIADFAALSDLGELHIETTPEGMAVYIDGQIMGVSPLLIRHLPTGDHQISVRESKTFEYQILRLTSNPSGVTVFINQQNEGQTPLSLPFELLKTPGSYLIEFQSNTNFKADLEILTQPDGVPFQLDQNTLRRSPVTFQQLSNKTYRLQVLGNHPVEVNSSVTIEKDKQEAQQLKITPYKFAKVVIDASEESTEIILNQESKGESPLSLNLSEGFHDLLLNKPRFKRISQKLQLEAGKTYDYHFQLETKSIDTSIFLTPTGEISPHFNISSKLFGLANYKANATSNAMGAGLASLEVDYGWPALGKFYNFLDLGLSLGGYAAVLQKGDQFSTLQGFGGKLQLFKENNAVPVSVAVGGYLNLDTQSIKPVGFISLSRNFFDFALHLGLQTHGMNLNIGYNGFDNLKLGFVVFANSLFGLLTESGEEISTLYGIQAGYRF